MGVYSITIRTFLLSFVEDENGLTDGYGVVNNGYFSDYRHYKEIIDTYYHKVFENMDLTIETKYKEDIETIKRDFCKRFYNREIGYETWAQFEVALEEKLNTTCFNLLKFYNLIRDMTVEDLAQTNNSTSTSAGDSKTLSLTSTQPQKDLSIIYDGSSIIRYADLIAENYGEQKQNANVVGSNTLPKFQLYNYFAQLPDIEEQIFNILDDKIFMGLF